jgi:hypothetical protein
MKILLYLIFLLRIFNAVSNSKILNTAPNSYILKLNNLRTNKAKNSLESKGPPLTQPFSTWRAAFLRASNPLRLRAQTSSLLIAAVLLS